MDAFLGDYLGVYDTEYYFLYCLVFDIYFSTQVKGALISRVSFEFNIVKYLLSLQSFWNDYYTLRSLTLYDFIQNEKITLDDLLFD